MSDNVLGDPGKNVEGGIYQYYPFKKRNKHLSECVFEPSCEPWRILYENGVLKNEIRLKKLGIRGYNII